MNKACRSASKGVSGEITAYDYPLKGFVYANGAFIWRKTTFRRHLKACLHDPIAKQSGAVLWLTKAPLWKMAESLSLPIDKHGEISLKKCSYPLTPCK